MDLARAGEIIAQMAAARVEGISFTAGEPLIYLDDICTLLDICRKYNIYTRVVTNCFWAGTVTQADRYIRRLRESGLSQMRMSTSRWHQENIPRRNVVNAADSCRRASVDYFISFVTDFSETDAPHEAWLRQHELKFFPEPVIFSGRAASFDRTPIRTDYQANCCPMNPYLAPNLDMFACCDAGSHFTRTNFFYLGNLTHHRIGDLFRKSEQHLLYQHIRHLGISAIASFSGFPSREIIGYRKCELCEKLFNSPDMLKMLKEEAAGGLTGWYR